MGHLEIPVEGMKMDNKENIDPITHSHTPSEPKGTYGLASDSDVRLGRGDVAPELFHIMYS